MTSNNNSRENIQESPLNEIDDINDYDTAFNAFQEGIYNTINEFLTEGTNPDQKWDIGDVCDAVFSGDGLRYMAHIKTINKQEGSCVIEFVHYSITENVLLSSLTPVSDYSLSPSKPKSSNVSNRDLETNPLNNEFVGEYFSENKEFLSSCGEAASFNCDLDPAWMLSERDPKTGQQRVGLVMDLDDSASGERVRTTFAPPSGLVTGEATPTLSQSSNYSNYCNMSSDSNQRIPVPLAPTCLSGATIDNVFASTLQSWYISGYHTGYYVAMRQLEKFRDECNGFSSSSGTATPLSSDLNLQKMINKKDTKAAQQMDLDDSASGEKVSATFAPSLSPMSVEAAPTLNQSSNMSGFSNQLISIPPEPPCLNGSTIDDAFAFTLNSWYMSGYHTGYYQAMKQFQK